MNPADLISNDSVPVRSKTSLVTAVAGLVVGLVASLVFSWLLTLVGVPAAVGSRALLVLWAAVVVVLVVRRVRGSSDGR